MLGGLRKMFMQMGIESFFCTCCQEALDHKHQQTLIKHIALMKLRRKKKVVQQLCSPEDKLLLV